MESAAKTDSLPSEAELRAMLLRDPGRVHCDGVRVQAMAREILRMRRDCPPTAEVEKQAAKRKQIVGELREVINRHSLERAGGDTPDHILAEAMLDTVLAFGERVQKRDAWHGFKPFSGFAFDPADPVGSKVGPATGQPRTEAHGTVIATNPPTFEPGATLVGGDGRKIPLVEPDYGSSAANFLDLGEAFRVAMRESGTADHEGQRLRWLRDAVAELAKVVERIGAR
jgi:hypothetical protein